MKTLAIRLHPGQDLRVALRDVCAEMNIEAACVVTCVGSLTRAPLRFAEATEATAIDGPLEIISLVGTLSRHGCHLHLSVADTQGVVTGGHLKDGAIVRTTAEIILGLIPDVRFARAYDDATGYEELDIAPLDAPE